MAGRDVDAWDVGRLPRQQKSKKKKKRRRRRMKQKRKTTRPPRLPQPRLLASPYTACLRPPCANLVSVCGLGCLISCVLLCGKKFQSPC